MSANPRTLGAEAKGPAPAAVSRERIYLFDTTLRDGAQMSGVDFSLEDKRQVAVMLDRLGVSGNLVDASFQALTDAITYKLMKETAGG